MTASRRPEQGSALVVTMIILTALAAGAASLVSVQMSSTKGNELSTSGNKSLYCAESGLAVGVPVVAANYTQWAATLGAGGTNEPAWLYAAIGSHDIDGDGRDDFAVYIKDNEDEAPPLTNDPTVDNDLKVFVVARCLEHTDTPREVQVLVQISGGGTCYKGQLGHCDNNDNNN
jgi:hypothetical protein